MLLEWRLFEPSTSEYARINPDNSYGTAGILRVNDVIFTSGVLKPGVYLVQISNEKSTTAKKLIVK